MKSRFIAYLGWGILLSGCSTLNYFHSDQSHPVASPPPASYYDTAPPVAVETAKASSRTYLRRRKFIIADDSVDMGYGAYGYVLLLKDPRNDQALKNKYIKLCEAYINSFSEFAQSEKPVAINKSAYFPTFWFLTKPVHDDHCSSYVDNYNYPRARMMAERIGLLFEDAPFLLAEQSAGISGNKNKRFYLSLKRISPDRMDETFNVWTNKITAPSGAWEQGWNLEIIRLQLASFVSTYGDSIYGVMR